LEFVQSLNLIALFYLAKLVVDPFGTVSTKCKTLGLYEKGTIITKKAFSWSTFKNSFFLLSL